MTPSRKRLPSSVVVPKTTLGQTTQLLGQLPEKSKDTLTLREAIAQLEAPVTAALAKGYDYDELADLLTQDGIEISTTSLKYHLTALKRKQGGDQRTKRGGSRKASGTRSITLVRSPDMSLAAKQEVEDVIAYLLEESPPQPKSPSATARSSAKATATQGKSALRKRK